MEEAANCTNSSWVLATWRNIYIIYILLFYQLFKSYWGVLSGIGQEFCCLIDVMAAIPVQLLTCRSYNYFEYCLEIIINHKQSLCLWMPFLSANGLRFERPKQSMPLSFASLNSTWALEERKCAVWHLAKQACLTWKQTPRSSSHCDLDSSRIRANTLHMTVLPHCGAPLAVSILLVETRHTSCLSLLDTPRFVFLAT